MQGYRTFPGESYPLRESLAVDPATGRVAYESETHINADAREWIRYLFDGEGRMLFIERLAGLAFWETGDALDEQALRYSNMVPHRIVADALANRETLEFAGVGADGTSRVRFRSSVGVSLTLYFDGTGGYPSGVSYRLAMPLLEAVHNLAGRPKSDCSDALARHLETGLDLSYEEFDQTMDRGFRALANMGCQAEAADLIERYIEANDAPQRSLTWHVAQLRAFTGDYERAIPFARASLNENEVIGPESLHWNEYVLATIAFLERDRNALVRHRDHVAGGIDGHPGNRMNLRLLDSLVRHFEESYQHALEKASRSTR